MPRYRDTFKLNPTDIDLIEQALRDQTTGAKREDGSTPCPRAIIPGFDRSSNRLRIANHDSAHQIPRLGRTGRYRQTQGRPRHHAPQPLSIL